MAVFITGDKELLRKLKTLDEKVERRALKKANAKAIRPVVRAAKAGVRPVSKTVAKGIGIRHKRYARTKTHVVVVGVRNQASVAVERQHTNPFTGETSMRKHDPRHTAHLIEGGTKPHTITIGKFSVRHPGTTAKPFLEPALERNETQVVAVHRSVLRQEILTAVK